MIGGAVPGGVRRIARLSRHVLIVQSPAEVMDACTDA
jgi:hypothetical protein